MSRTQNFWNEVTFPLAKPGQTRKPDPENDCGFQVMEDILMIEQTIDRRTPCGVLSLAAVICIEQFRRCICMNCYILDVNSFILVLGPVHSSNRIYINRFKTKVYN